jgi:hypothetical protein
MKAIGKLILCITVLKELTKSSETETLLMLVVAAQ